MGYAEEAKINLAKLRSGKTDETTLAIAQVQATLAVLEAVEEVASQLAYLNETKERTSD